MKVLVTGCAGFIGSHLTDRFLAKGYSVIGVDNFNDYYDPKIKSDNLRGAQNKSNFKLYKEDILHFKILKKIFQIEEPTTVVHLAARAGVRPSIENPVLYEKVNVCGTLNLLKLSVDFKVGKFIFGSSSSVYGNSKKNPFEENDLCQDIISPYGASKRAAEFAVESFWHSFGLKSLILRFFTVYGPRGRPDMAPALFSKAIITNKEFVMFGDGTTKRDYTYIDDICDGIVKACESRLKFEVINLGNNRPVSLSDFIKTLEKIIGRKAKVKKIPMQNGDVISTWASIRKANNLLGWKPKIDLETGLQKYIAWRIEQ